MERFENDIEMLFAAKHPVGSKIEALGENHTGMTVHRLSTNEQLSLSVSHLLTFQRRNFAIALLLNCRSFTLL